MTDDAENPGLTAKDFTRMRPATVVLSQKVTNAFDRRDREVLAPDDFTHGDPGTQ